MKLNARSLDRWKCATVLTPGKVRCSPSSPCSRARARCAWPRVAPLLPIPSAARRGLGSARSGRERQARRSNRKAGRPFMKHRQTTSRRRNPHASIDKLTWRPAREHSGMRQYGLHPDCREGMRERTTAEWLATLSALTAILARLSASPPSVRSPVVGARRAYRGSAARDRLRRGRDPDDHQRRLIGVSSQSCVARSAATASATSSHRRKVC
jgi:hypothetical protein